MPTLTELREEIDAIFATKWTSRSGKVVPESDSVTLGNDAVEIEGTVLYADLQESTALVDSYKGWFAAEVYKAFLATSCRIIRANGGSIAAFDGDRVMAVFVGDSKNSQAVKSALGINWAVLKAIHPAIKSAYPDSSYILRHCVGIDTSKLFVAKTGIRNANDLVWVGRAANYAAKLSAFNDAGFPTWITEQVYKKLNEASKFGGQPKRDMWEKRSWSAMGLTVYRSNWHWELG